ncbi:M20/M25/M40 family metallo-hydrolase [Mesoterricola sediminis]|uniref:Carboxypeptidase Q n=1 Tax=Mesoterricola sediminis TaxID=2927980 RepID=A0AA48GRD8_9BACT|nr:M20/M25/M40 family metallo-hydrolase [Mesoterricola sediminis]BDU77861.1 aminopeptidase [Mesoterricola sediminis]
MKRLALFWLGTLLMAGSPDPMERVRSHAAALATRAVAHDGAYRDLEVLCDEVGHRLSGSEGYDRAVAWAVKAMKAAGLENVHTEPVLVPHWVRNAESARMTLPAPHDLSILGLGMSVPTPPGGITADVVVVASLAELEAMPAEKVKGRIVLFEDGWKGYGHGARMRFSGATAASRKGAVAMLLRSVASLSFDTPHTGTLHYEEGVPPIPAAAVSVENALMMRRMWNRGLRMQVHLEMNCRTLPDAPAANVVGDLPGASRPDQVVLVGGHLDSWDVGQGAQDDGVGCVLSLQAARMIKEAGLRPARTVRVVFFANEENGTRGGEGYLKRHEGELARHVAALESDSGSGLARGFGLELHPRPGQPAPDPAKALAVLQLLKPMLEPLGAGRLGEGHGGVDIGPSVLAGVPGLGMNHDTAKYWEVHHSKADTFDKVDKGDLARNGAILAVAVYALADMPGTLTGL